MDHRPLAVEGHQAAERELLPVVSVPPVQRMLAVVRQSPVPPLGQPVSRVRIAARLDEPKELAVADEA